MSNWANLDKAMFRKVFLIVSLGALLAVLIVPLQPFTPAYAEEPEPECWAAIIGVPAQRLALRSFIDAEGNAYPLGVKYPDDSARDLARRLSSVWGEDHVRLLLNGEATKADIYYAIKWLAEMADADDTVLFYFCGHGYLAPCGHLSYLPIPEYVPRDTVSVYLCAYDIEISDEELDKWLSRLDSESVVVILDICYAGSFSKKLSQDGRVVMMSCEPEESSWESRELKHGVFTHYILQALSSFDVADTNYDYELSAEEVFDYAKPRTVDEVIAPYANVPVVEDKQHPMLYDSRYSEELGLLMRVVFRADARFSPDTAVLTVDGRSHLSGELPASFTWAVGSVHEFAVPSEVDTAKGTRLVFTSWDDGDTSVSRTVSRGGEYTAEYQTQHLLTIESAYGDPDGAGWYDSGSTATISVSASEGTIVRRVFAGWSGDFAGPEAAALVTMDAPKAVTANWRTDYLRLYILIAGVMALVGAAVSAYILRNRLAWWRSRLRGQRGQDE